MIVVVADAESFARIEAALPDRPVEHVPSGDAAEPASGAHLVVVDTTTVESRGLLADLRGDPRVPPAIVVIVDGGDSPEELLPVDEVVYAPFEESVLSAAVDRALLAAEYREAVDRLYAACTDRAAEGTVDPFTESDDLREARRTADEILEAAADEPGLLTALLRGTGDDE